jgi:hypothetical protein
MFGDCSPALAAGASVAHKNCSLAMTDRVDHVVASVILECKQAYKTKSEAICNN